MTAGLVTIGRRQYAVGLYWENSPGGSVSTAAKEASRQPGQHAAFYAVRGGNKNGRVAQFGLAPDGIGFRYGQPVLAACLANQQPGSWAGAFRLREGIVVAVVRDDLIVPDGDLFFQDETEARDRLLQEMGFGGLQRIYAPEAWGVPGADTMPLSLLLNDRSDVSLKPIEIPRSLIVGGLVGLVFLLGILGGGWYYQAEKAQEEADRLAKFAAMQKAQEAARKMVPSVLQEQVVNYPAPERKWEKKPLPLDVVESCKEGLKKVPLVTVGWQIVTLKCDGSSISVVWQKTAGYATIPENATINETGSSASATISLQAPKARGQEDLMDVASVTRRILGQNWNAHINRGASDPPPPPPPNFSGNWNPPPPPWVKRSFTLSAPVLPWTLSTFFADFPGLVVTGLSASGIKAPWVVEGVIYENRR